MLASAATLWGLRPQSGPIAVRLWRSLGQPTGADTLIVMFAVATAALAAAMATGVGAQTGVVDTSSVRWVHHGLFATTVATALTALVLTPRRAERAALVPALVVLARLPRTKGGTRAHGATAALIGACYGAGWVGRSWS